MSKDTTTIVDILNDGDELTDDQVSTIVSLIAFLEHKSWEHARSVYDDEDIAHTVKSHMAFCKGMAARVVARLLMLHETKEEFENSINEVMDNALTMASDHAGIIEKQGVEIPDWLQDVVVTDDATEEAMQQSFHNLSTTVH